MVVRYRKLAREASQWYKACKALATELSQKGPGLLLRMLGALRNNPTRGYPGRRDYGHIRICRLFMYALGVHATDGQEDWNVYKRCSPHFTQSYQLYNISSHADALSTREFMRIVFGMPKYSPSDLTAYICLRAQKPASMIPPTFPRKPKAMNAMTYANTASRPKAMNAMEK